MLIIEQCTSIDIIFLRTNLFYNLPPLPELTSLPNAAMKVTIPFEK